MTRVVLVTAQPRDASTGESVTVRLAGGGNRKGYYYGDEHYRSGIATQVRFKAEIGIDDTGWNGAAIPTTGVVEFAPHSSDLLNELAGYVWKDADIEVQDGDEETETFATRLIGRVAEAKIEGNRLKLTIADFSRDLERFVVTERFEGSGGAEGGEEARGRIKRRTWGETFNIEGRILDKVNNIYEFGDPAYPWQEFVTVRDKGMAADPAPAIVTWQGSIADTLTALVAATPISGSAVVAPSIACIKWWTQPAGPLTADVKGEVGDGYVDRLVHIAEAILENLNGPEIANASAANILRAGAHGIHVDENETIASVLDRLFLPNSMLWLLDGDGEINLREITFGDPVETLISDKVERTRSLPPMHTRRIGYQHAYRVHDDGEIATSLGAEDGAGVFTMVAGANVRTTPNSVEKISGAATWNAGAYSLEGYADDVMVTAQIPDVTKNFAFGLNSDPATDDDQASIDFAVAVIDASGGLGAQESGTPIASIGTISNGDVLYVRRRGSTVEYGVIGESTPRHTTTGHDATVPLHFDCSLANVGAKLDSITFNKIGEDGVSAKSLTVQADRQTFTFDGAGNLDPGSQTVVVTANPQNFTGGDVVWSYSDNLGTASATLAALITATSANVRTIPSSVFSGTPTRTWLKVTATGQAPESDLSDTTTIVRLEAGSPVLTAVMTNETHSIPTDAAGANGDFSGANGKITVYWGADDVTASATLSEVSETNCTGTINTATNSPVSGQPKGYYRVTAMSADTATYRIGISYNPGGGAITQNKDFTLSKAKAGVNAKTLTVNADSYIFTFDGGGNLDPASQEVVVTANPQNFINGNVSWSYTDNLGTSSSTLDDHVDNDGANQRTINDTIFTSNASRKWVKATATGQGSESTLTDSVTISRLDAGSNALTLVQTNPTHSVPTDSDGNNGQFSGADGRLYVYHGTDDVTAASTLSEVSESGCTGTINTSTNSPVSGQPKGYYRVTAMSADVAAYTMQAIYNPGSGAITRSTVFTLSKSKAGSSAVQIFVYSDRQQVYFDAAGQLFPGGTTQDIDFVVTRQNTSATVSYELETIDGVDVSSLLDNETNSGCTLSAADFKTVIDGGKTGVVLTASMTVNGDVYSDVVSVVMVKSAQGAITGIDTSITTPQPQSSAGLHIVGAIDLDDIPDATGVVSASFNCLFSHNYSEPLALLVEARWRSSGSGTGVALAGGQLSDFTPPGEQRGVSVGFVGEITGNGDRDILLSLRWVKQNPSSPTGLSLLSSPDTVASASLTDPLFFAEWTLLP